MTHTGRTFHYKFLTILFLIILAGAAPAAVWYVDSDIGSGGDGTSWATAFDTIQEAIDAASSLYMICYAPIDVIYVKSGTYTLSSELILDKTVTLYGGFPNSLSSPTLSNRNPGVYATIINGNNSVRCMTVTTYSVIDGFTFQNGHTTLNAGAIYVDETPTYSCFFGDISTTIRNCKFLNNFAGVHGGAVYDLRSNLVISNCQFYGNSADNGGAIKQWQTTSTIEKCIFSGNTSTTGGFGGGAILGDYQVYGSIINCLFVDNTSASYGGAISYHQAWTDIINCTFADNTATTSGGALYTNTASPVLKNCILWDDSPDEIIDYYSSPGPTATYCDIEGGFTGSGNINSNPLFIGSGNYHLGTGSPCFDTGSDVGAPTEDLEENARPMDGDGDGTAVTDMGAYEYEYVNVDLRVTGISLDPEVPRVGEPVTVTVTFRNYGTTDAEGFYVDWYADASTAPVLSQVGNRYQYFSLLAAGASDSMVKTYTYTTEGLKHMYAQIDTEDTVEETYENNNIYGPISTWAMTGTLLDFNVIHDQYTVSHFFGGDDGATKRNVGVGQSIIPTRPAHVTSAGFHFSGDFDYYYSPDGYGHAVILNLRVRESDGTVIKSIYMSVPASFKGGWILFPLGDLWLEADQTYIFTCYLYQGEYNELCSGVYGRVDDPWPTSTGYRAIVYGQPANMITWANWTTHNWDFNFQMKGQYVEHYPGDINDDRSVDMGDLDVLAQNWLVNDCIMPGWCDNSDINWNSIVRLEDFNILSRYWLETYHAYEDLNRAAVVTLYNEMSTASIYGSDGSEFNPGTYFVYRTSAGRYGKFIVEDWNHADSNKLTIAWVTYNASGTVYSSGTGLVIRGTYSCDLDTGAETTTYCDFTWVQSTSTVRYLAPQNGARFKLMYKAP